jgi:hypothetical protein
VVLDLQAYLAAEIDPYDEVGESLARHLTVAHQALLRALLPEDADPDIAAAVAQDVGPHGLTVRAITADGSRPYPVRFAQPAPHPHHFGTAMHGWQRDQSTRAE